ncbi:MAG: SAM hydrolase/SAM-dependent halogenase family protein [Pseudomonadota bacterium]
MIALFTDFGLNGPYTGQMKAAILKRAPGLAVVDLFADVPAYSVNTAAHLLAAYHQGFPAECCFLCVVDPGVGSLAREPVILQADEHWFVGPGNGLFDVVAARASEVNLWRILWRPEQLSATFHGRDLFAPVAAMLAQGEFPEAEGITSTFAPEVADELSAIIYVDHFGNLITGLRAQSYPPEAQLSIGGVALPRLRTFNDADVGAPFCYENSVGLLEIAVNQGRADQRFAAKVGDGVLLKL